MLLPARPAYSPVNAHARRGKNGRKFKTEKEKKYELEKKN
jgi:hypothetical protein